MARPLMSRREIESLAQSLIDYLDAEDGDPDMEPDVDADVEDYNAIHTKDWRGGAGDADDAEPDHDAELDLDDEYSVPEWVPQFVRSIRRRPARI